MKRVACLAFFLVACSDGTAAPADASDVDTGFDAGDVDAGFDAASLDATTDAAPLDAGVDASPDAGGPLYEGTLTAFELAVLNPGTSGTFFGQGVQLGIHFGDPATRVAPSMEEQPGSALGCKLYDSTAAQAMATSVGTAEGSVTVTLDATAYPVCTFNAGVGYLCPHLTTASTGGTIGLGPLAGTATLTDLDVTFNSGNTTNRFVNISGATLAANNGTFPILAVGGANTIVYANPPVVAETLPVTAYHVNLAGVGVTPSAPDPGFLTDATAVSFALVAGGGDHFSSFTATTGTGGVGDDFALALAELNNLNALPATATDFTVSCTAAGCPAGSAEGTIISIVTTDASTADLSPFAMPPPATRSVKVECTQLGVTSITVPAAYMAALMGSGATRIQTTFLRPTFITGGPGGITMMAGHGITGFTNR